MKYVKVADRVVGAGQPCYVVAEAGANHNRDFGMACELIDVAVEANADAVKFQTYSADTLYSKKTPRFKYLEAQGDVDTHALLKSIELPREWQEKLADYARGKGIAFYSSPFDRCAVDELDEIGVPAFKIASFELVDLPLIRYAAGKGKPMILSTGMATMGEIEDAVEACRSAGSDQVVLLQCVSLYPTEPRLMNLRAMETMRVAFGVPVGLSDHTLGINIPIGAAALGMAMVEKHYTLRRSLPGPDHTFAVEPRELKEMVAGIRAVEIAMGDGKKAGPSPEERAEMYRLGRRSLVAATEIPAGTVITDEMLTVKRPGYGIMPKFAELVVGRSARVHISADDVITWEMV